MTAARGLVAGGDDAAATAPGAEWPAIAALCGLVILAVGLRLVPTVIVPSLNWGDEVFQTIEPAHRLVFGYGLVPWEYQLHMRFWLLPGVIAGLIELSRLVGEAPQIYLGAIAIGLGLLAATPVVCAFLWCRRELGVVAALVAGFAVAVAPELVYFGARALNEVAAAHLLLIAIYLVAPGYRVASRQRLFAAALLLGIASLMRINLAPAAAVVGLWALAGGWRARLPVLAAGGMIALGFGAILDWLTLGYPFASIWRNLVYNLYYGVSYEIGVDPAVYYLQGELGVWLTAAPALLVLIGLGARRLPLVAVTGLVVLAVHSAIAHKEYRFIYPAILLAMVLAAVGLAQLVAWGARLLTQRIRRPGLALALPALLLAAYWGAVSANVWSGEAFRPLRQRAHDELAAMLFARDLPGLCGVGLYGEEAWIRYGGYSYLHRPVPMYWPKDEVALTAAAPAFDLLLYEAQPPTGLGFTALRCFGRICVARRAGGCAPRQTPQIWFPESLRGMIPPRGRYEPLPGRNQ